MSEMEPLAAFEGIVLYEAAVARGTHVRALVGSAETGPLGLAWMPASLDAAPPEIGARILEMESPSGERLFYVPLACLDAVAQAGAVKLGIDPTFEPRFRALASLGERSTEPAVNSLFDLIVWLASQARSGVPSPGRRAAQA